jgi:hypothetical protein
MTSKRLFLEPLEDRRLMAADLPAVPEWLEQGPALISNGQVEGLADKPVAGAVNSIAVHPNKKFVVVGTVNGGIWTTQDIDAPNNLTWEPTTDQYPSLAIGDIAFSPLDKNGNVLDAATPVENTVIYAATGNFSSGWQGGGGIGLLKSVDGGKKWSVVGKDLSKLPLKAVVPTSFIHPETNKQVVLVAAIDRQDVTGAKVRDGGIFRSKDGGRTFKRLSGLSDPAVSIGLPAGPVTSLIPDTNDPAAFFAGISGKGIYRGVWQPATGKMEWVAVNKGLTDAAGAAATNIKLAAGGTAEAGKAKPLYVGLVRADGKLNEIFRSDDRGENWDDMTPPYVMIQEVIVDLNGDNDTSDPNENSFQVFAPHNGNPPQGNMHFSIVADPFSPHVVYVGGDRQWSTTSPNAPGSTDWVGALFRGDASRPAGSQWQPIVSNFANGTAPHADSRDMVFVGQHIFEADDGGLYRLYNPSLPPTRYWESRNGNLRINEQYSAAYDHVHNVILSANQDTGSAEQPLTAGDGQSNDGDAEKDELDERTTWNGIYVGDGFAQGVGVEAGKAFRYTLANNFYYFFRREVNGAGLPGALQPLEFVPMHSAVTAANMHQGLSLRDRAFATSTAQAVLIKFAVNPVEGQRLLIGYNDLYESDDRGVHVTPIEMAAMPVARPPLLSRSVITALAYGGRELIGGTFVNRPDVLYVAKGNAIGVRRPLPGPLYSFGAALDHAFAIDGAATIWDIAIHPDDWRKAYAVDDRHVYMTADGGETWQALGSAPATTDFRSVEIVRVPARPAAPGVPAEPAHDVLLVGGSGRVSRARPRPVTTPADVDGVCRPFAQRPGDRSGLQRRGRHPGGRHLWPGRLGREKRQSVPRCAGCPAGQRDQQSRSDPPGAQRR